MGGHLVRLNRDGDEHERWRSLFEAGFKDRADRLVCRVSSVRRPRVPGKRAVLGRIGRFSHGSCGDVVNFCREVDRRIPTAGMPTRFVPRLLGLQMGRRVTLRNDPLGQTSVLVSLWRWIRSRW